jgi:hypothetical protein
MPASRRDPTFIVYIDESGDEGFSFNQGSSEWFVLAAVITRRTTDLETVKLVDRVRSKLGKPGKKPLHFRDLKHEQRLPFVGEIAEVCLRAVTILVHKPSIREPEKFRERYRLYFYGVRYLLERVSWYCRDHKTSRDKGDGSAEIVFSNRSGMSYHELREYLRLLEAQTGFFDVRIEWSVINTDQIVVFSAGRRMGLQIADAVAGSFFYAVQPSQYGYTEDRHARILKPVVYHQKGRYLGHGLKFWPREAESMVRTEDSLRWVQEDYAK